MHKLKENRDFKNYILKQDKHASNKFLGFLFMYKVSIIRIVNIMQLQSK